MKVNDRIAYEQAIEICEDHILICKWRGTRVFEKLCEEFGGDSNYTVMLFKHKHAKWLFRWYLIQFKIRKVLGIKYPFYEWMTEDEYLEMQAESLAAYGRFFHETNELVKSGVVEL